MSRPWLLHLGPMVLSTDAREELNALGVGLSTKEYVRKVWDARQKAAPPVKRVRSKSWPKTCRTDKGFVLPRQTATNVHPIEQRKRKP